MLIGLGSVGAVSLGALSARANLEVSASVRIHSTVEFYDPLSAYGTWITVGSYGRCWRPVQVTVEWRPYCYGHWVWTDCGWYWASDEPWAWACYHYGSWAYDPPYGWIWIPGIDWAPAWVTWRVGGGYIGWAPLPPHGVTIAGPQFVFVQEARFREPVRPDVVVVNNTAIFGKTTVVSNVKRETRSLAEGREQVVVNEGPGLAPVEKATGRKVQVVPIQEAARQTVRPTRTISGTRTAPGERERGQSFEKVAPPEKAIRPSEPRGRHHEPKKEGKEHEGERGQF